MDQNQKNQELYAILAKSSYDTYHNGINEAQNELGKYSQTKEYHILPEFTNKNATVIEKGNDVVISYRGTDLKNPSDLFADFEILMGRDKMPIFLNDRFDEANKLYNKIKTEMPDKNITLTGHSLGSAQSIYVGLKNDIPSYSFNTGTSPFSTLFSQLPSKGKDKQNIYLTGKDIISNLAFIQPYKVHYVEANNDLNFVSHDINYFLPEYSEKSEKPNYLQPIAFPTFKPQKVKFSGVINRINDYDSFAREYFKQISKKKKKFIN
jgi:hypothetical protein